MSDARNTTCKYYNTGFCKFRDVCHYLLSTIICSNISCRDRKCLKRHPKLCRYKENCRRRTTCLYKHDENEGKYIKLEAENKALTEKINALHEKTRDIEKLNVEIENLKSKCIQWTHLSPIETFIYTERQIFLDKMFRWVLLTLLFLYFLLELYCNCMQFPYFSHFKVSR